MASRVVRTLVTSLVLGTLAVACSDLRDDGFTGQITHRCATPKGCEEALKDANARLAKCADPSSGECLSVKEDVSSVERLNKRHVDEAAARAESAKIVDDQIAKARAADDARKAGQKTLEEVTTGHGADLHTALADCRATADMAKCDNGSPTPAEKTECLTNCQQFGATRAEDLFRLMLRACTDTAEADPKHTNCLVDGRVWSPRTRADECSRKCASLATKLHSWASAKVKCCDGGFSAKCKNAELRTDCCDDHKGICPEPKPQDP